jgi:hypothetical protein
MRIGGVTSRPSLNGTFAFVHAYDAESDRYDMCLHDGTVAHLRDANLTPVPHPEDLEHFFASDAAGDGLVFLAAIRAQVTLTLTLTLTITLTLTLTLTLTRTGCYVMLWCPFYRP